MLYWLLWQKFLDARYYTTLERRLNDIVEKKGTIYEQSETDNLKPLECFPAEAKGDYPYK
jgi:hypothetical protein